MSSEVLTLEILRQNMENAVHNLFSCYWLVRTKRRHGPRGVGFGISGFLMGDLCGMDSCSADSL